MTTLREITLLRLAAQGIADPGDRTPADAVRHMLCLQGQDYPGVVRSIALRTASGEEADVKRAMDDGEIVRSWPLRGTLFATPAEDLPWMLELMGERVLTGFAKRREQLGIDERLIERARRVALKTLEPDGRMTRAQLMEAWEGLLGDVKQRGYHLLWTLSLRGHLCFGPTLHGGEHLIVSLPDWVAEPRRLEGEAALAELARRYFASHGPATAKDFLWWTKLPAKEGRGGIADAREHLEAVEADGTEYLMDPRTPDALAACRKRAEGIHLLPGFDEYVLGYQNRDAPLPPEFADRIVPGNNGIFRPTVVDRGRIVGTWKRQGKGAKAAVVGEPFTTFTKKVGRALASG